MPKVQTAVRKNGGWGEEQTSRVRKSRRENKITNDMKNIYQ